MEFDEKYLWQYISIAPPGLDRTRRRDPCSQSLAWGLTLIAAPQLCCVITSNVEAKRNMDQAGDLCDSLPDLVSEMSEIKRYA